MSIFWCGVGAASQFQSEQWGQQGAHNSHRAIDVQHPPPLEQIGLSNSSLVSVLLKFCFILLECLFACGCASNKIGAILPRSLSAQIGLNWAEKLGCWRYLSHLIGLNRCLTEAAAELLPNERLQRWRADNERVRRPLIVAKMEK